MIKLNELESCRFIQTVRGGKFDDTSPTELQEQYNEFEQSLMDLFFGSSGYLDISWHLDMLLYDLEDARSKKKVRSKMN